MNQSMHGSDCLELLNQNHIILTLTNQNRIDQMNKDGNLPYFWKIFFGSALSTGGRVEISSL